MFAEDLERLEQLPEEAMQELRSYIAAILDGKKSDDPSCIWLDRESLQCRYHEHRPSICRKFEISSDDCRGWRKEYQIVDDVAE